MRLDSRIDAELAIPARQTIPTGSARLCGRLQEIGSPQEGGESIAREAVKALEHPRPKSVGYA